MREFFGLKINNPYCYLAWKKHCLAVNKTSDAFFNQKEMSWLEFYLIILFVYLFICDTFLLVASTVYYNTQKRKNILQINFKKDQLKCWPIIHLFLVKRKHSTILTIPGLSSSKTWWPRHPTFALG